MSSRIFIDAPLQADIEDVTAQVLPSVYRPMGPDEAPDLSVEAEVFDRGVLLRVRGAPDSVVERVAEALARRHVRVIVYQLMFVGQRPRRQLEATELRWERGRRQARDISDRCQHLAEELEVDAHDLDDVWEDEAAHQIMEVLPPPHPVDERHTLGFVSRVPGRLRSLVQLLEDGAAWGWTEVAGQRALRVTHRGASQLSVLAPEEAALLVPWLDPEEP